MKSAKVSELKARLSYYLREVKQGETVEVLDRRTPVARLVPVEEDGSAVRVHRADLSPDTLRRLQPVRLKKAVDLGKLLRQSREDRF